MSLPFKDRAAAGRELARALGAYRGRADVLVLALPRGGVAVGCEVALALGVELDLWIVRKLGAPGQPELALGAIASGGVRVMNEELLASLGVAQDTVERIARREQEELERRERAYRGARPRPALEGRCAIVVDDGVATGATMRAGVRALRGARPARVVVAVPVAPLETVELLRAEADEVVCVATPEPFFAIGRFYLDFPQLTDAEVRELLARVWGEGRARAPALD